MRLVVPPLSETRVVAAELDAAFDAIADHVNTPNLRSDHLGLRTVGYRQLAHAPVRVPHQRSTNLGISGPFGGWYEMTGLRVAAIASITNALNQDGRSAPVMLVDAILYLSDWITTLAAGRFRIGYTRDSGATWTTLAATERPVGRGSGEEQRYFDAGQLHYYTQAPGYRPFNQPADGFIVLLAAFGGPNSMADPMGITHYSVFVNHNTLGDGLDHGNLLVRMREPTA